jgi:hypothetical protein
MSTKHVFLGVTLVSAAALLAAWALTPGSVSVLRRVGPGPAAAAHSRSKPSPRVQPPASAPPAPRVTATPTARSEEVFTAPWGGRRGELGRRAANESSPEGPMSFAVDTRGRAFVLDQVNGRVQIFERGQAPRTLPLPADTYQDVALAQGDGVVLLDRLGKETVAFADATGKISHEIALQGRGVPEAGDVTGLFQRDDGTWVEVKHANLVHIADADGAPIEERSIVQGRFGSQGSVLRASKSGDRAAWIAERTERGVTPLAKVSFDLPVWQLLELDTDPRGRIFLAASLLQESAGPPFDVEDAREVVVVLDAVGTEVLRVELPASTGPEESFRRVRLGGDGALYHLAYEERGVTLRRVSL